MGEYPGPASSRRKDWFEMVNYGNLTIGRLLFVMGEGSPTKVAVSQAEQVDPFPHQIDAIEMLAVMTAQAEGRNDDKDDEHG